MFLINPDDYINKSYRSNWDDWSLHTWTGRQKNLFNKELGKIEGTIALEFPQANVQAFRNWLVLWAVCFCCRSGRGCGARCAKTSCSRGQGTASSGRNSSSSGRTTPTTRCAGITGCCARIAIRCARTTTHSAAEDTASSQKDDAGGRYQARPGDWGSLCETTASWSSQWDHRHPHWVQSQNESYETENRSAFEGSTKR